MTLAFALFPYSAETAKNGGDTRPLILKASAASFAFCIIIASAFFFIGQPILSLLPGGSEYAGYWWVIPCQIGINAINVIPGLYTTAEMSTGRFGFLKWLMPIEIGYPILLLAVTGHSYFTAFLPNAWTEFLNNHNIKSLGDMLIWMAAGQLIRLACCCIAMLRTTALAR